MGISASIAGSSRKYRTNGDFPHPRKSTKHSSIEYGDDNEDDLASVSSFRPSSPLAHQDARAFTLDGAHTKQRDPRPQVNRHSYYGNIEPSYPASNRHSSYHGSLERSSRAGNGSHNSTYSVREPSSRALVSQSASSVYGSRPGRTMRDVKEFLLNNPELLAGKKSRRMTQSIDSDLYGLSNNHKQMKTKQSVYMGLIKPPPVVYGAGVRPDQRQLRVDQKLYLNLVYPTIRPKEYHKQAMIRSRPPLKQEGMVVVRKDDYSRQSNGYIKRPQPQMQVSRVPEAPKAKGIPESVRRERTIAQYNASTSTGSRGQSQHSARTKGTSNDYVDFPDIVQEPLTSRPVKNGREVLKDRQMNGFVTPGNSQQNIAARQFKGREADQVVFTFNVDDLDLRRKTEVARFEHDKDTGQVVPLYFRKSLAYSPKKYEYSEDILSSPL